VNSSVFKVVLVGDAKVGKTKFVDRLRGLPFTRQYNGVFVRSSIQLAQWHVRLSTDPSNAHRVMILFWLSITASTEILTRIQQQLDVRYILSCYRQVKGLCRLRYGIVQVNQD